MHVYKYIVCSMDSATVSNMEKDKKKYSLDVGVDLIMYFKHSSVLVPSNFKLFNEIT